MSNLSLVAKTQLAKLPEVVAIVVTDGVGALLEATGDLDSEAVGAIHIATKQALARCGNALALGTLQRFTVTGPRHACLVSIFDHEVLGVYLDPTKPIGTFERKLETALGR